MPLAARTHALQRGAWPRRGKSHDVPGELIVSLTSYPARFGTLHLTLACLLDQTVRPDRVILWIAGADLGRLPPEVLKLEERGLEIRQCEDLRSFKKLVPALQAFPDSFIATADDDQYYAADWLEQLVDGLAAECAVVTCHRAHRIKRRPDGSFAPYLEWDIDVQDDLARRASADLMPTGVGGLLYPPRALDPIATERDLFELHCPDGDDLWFYWCARMAGTTFKKVGPKTRLLSWPGMQAESLWEVNEKGGNDRMIAALEANLPLDARSPPEPPID